jgi:transposase
VVDSTAVLFAGFGSVGLTVTWAVFVIVPMRVGRTTIVTVAVAPTGSGSPEKLRTREGRAFRRALELAADARERIEVALRMIDAIEAQLAPLERELRHLARRQTGCRAPMGLYGMGELTSLVTRCELGDVGRLSASRKAVRMAGIDIGVHRSDRRARVGKLTPQGSPQLRWALYEAALAACRPSSPDHADYLALKARGLSHTRASLTIARKLARRSYHVLRKLGPAALDPIATT